MKKKMTLALLPAALLAAAFAYAALAQHDEPGDGPRATANQAIAFDAAASSLDAVRPPVAPNTTSTQSISGVAPASTGEVAAAPMPMPATPIDRESAALGAPNGILSSRPVEQSPVDRGGLFSAIDPRTNEIVRVGFALAIVLTLLLGVRFVMRRFGGAAAMGGAGGDRPSGVIEILARYPVGRGQQLVLIKLARRVLLVHRSGSAMTTLAEVSDGDEVASLLSRIEAGSRGKSAARFKRILQQFEHEHEDAGGRANPIPMPAPRGQVIDLTRRPATRSASTKRRWSLSA